jgi:hypothetical protein
LDSILFATGFDAMTGALRNIEIRGRAGARMLTNRRNQRIHCPPMNGGCLAFGDR